MGVPAPNLTVGEGFPYRRYKFDIGDKREGKPLPYDGWAPLPWRMLLQTGGETPPLRWMGAITVAMLLQTGGETV